MIDYFDPDTFARGIPHDRFTALRTERPISWQSPRGDADGYWLITRHPDVVFVSRHPELFTSTAGTTLYDAPPAAGRSGPWAMVANNLGAQDPPRHAASRQVIHHAFAAKALARLEPAIRREAQDLLERAIAKSTCDFAEEVALALPVRIVLGELLGIPRTDHPKLVEWSVALVAPEDRALAPGRDAGLRALEAMHAYGAALVRERRASPGEDLISALTQARTPDGQPLTDELILEYWFPLLVGAFDTTAATAAGGVLALAEHPAQWQRLRAEPALLPTAVDEILRWVSPVLYFRRTATQDVELRGQTIRQGQRVLLCYPAANRDEEVFRAPHEFEISRSPNPHLSFGFGPHTCLGARLAKLQLQILFEELSARAREISLAGAPRWVRSAWVHRLHSLPIRLDRLEPAAASASASSRALAPSRASISHGAPLREAGAPASLPQVLIRAANTSADRGLVHVRQGGTERVQRYPELLEDARRISAGLRGRGLLAGDLAILYLDRDEDFVAAFWGCVLGGLIPCPFPAPPGHDSAAALSKLGDVARRLDRAVIATTRATAAAIGAEPGVSALRPRVVELEALQAHTPDDHVHDAREDEPALILLTSGSTGVPKGVVHSHGSLASMIRGMIQSYGLSDQETLLNWIPLDHVGGIAFIHLMGVHLQSQQVLLQKEAVLRDPLTWIDAMARHRATLTWAPNFAFALLNARADEIARRRWDLSAMRYLGNAGESIVPRSARRTLELLRPHGLPESALHPMWGMSETASAAITSERFSLAGTSDDDQLVELGLPIPGLSMRVVDDAGALVPEGAIGNLEVRGPSVIRGYLPALPAEGDAFTHDGWFRTGDCGFLRDGRLTMTGRSKDVIIIHGNNHWTHTIEAAAAAVPGVAPSSVAACGVRWPDSDTDELVIFLCPADPDAVRVPALLEAARRAVIREVGIRPRAIIPLAAERIPRTQIGKIQRAQLARAYAAGELDAIVRSLGADSSEGPARPGEDPGDPAPSRDAPRRTCQAPRTALETALATAWRDVLPVEDVGIEDDFFDVGGNSILLVQLQRAVQDRTGRSLSLRELLDHPRIAAMASYLGEPRA
jgi:cytochrome P450/acyl-CoA synthetase (AMP-forming)/AMP-acid ligase II